MAAEGTPGIGSVTVLYRRIISEARFSCLRRLPDSTLVHHREEAGRFGVECQKGDIGETMMVLRYESSHQLYPPMAPMFVDPAA
jgi:hypothetical protein